MDDIWSGSDVPFLFENEDHTTKDVLVAINCTLNHKGDRYDFLQSGYISRILSSHEEKAFEGGQFTLWFFDRPFVDKSLYVSEERNAIFKCLRSSIFCLMRLPSHGFQVTNHDDSSIQKLRKDITRVLYFCNNTINRCNFSEAPPELDDIVDDLGSLSMSVGSVSQLANIYSLRKIQKDILMHALFHMTLELNIHYILLVFQLATKYPDATTYQTRFTQISQAMVHDQIVVSNILYKQTKSSSKSMWQEDSHLCSCVKEVWVVLIHTVDALSKTFSMQSFWSVVSTVLQGNHGNNMINNSQIARATGTENCVQEYSVEFKVWLLCSIAPLYWIDAFGNNNFDKKSIVPRNWQTIQELIQHTLSDTTVRTETIHSLVWSCTYLTKHWDVQLNVFCLLWDYFNKDMNNVRKGDPHTMNSFVKTVYSPGVKFDSCVSYTAEVATLNETDTSFDLFLRYLVVIVKRLKLKNEVQMLSQIKGRIYSKFHKRRMEEMNVNGLEKFTTLFTIVALVFNIDEIPKKMCSLICLLQFNQKQVEIKKQIILNLFICLITCKNLKLPVAETIVQKIIDLFNNLISLLWESKKKKELYIESWDLVCYYLDCVEQCFDYNIGIPEEALLLCPTYARLLKISLDNQKKRIYMHFKCILSSSYMQQKPVPSNVYDLIWKNIYLPLSESIMTENNSGHVSEIFAGVTILSSESSLSEGDNNFELLINKYGFSEVSSVAFKCCYLSHILSSSSIVQKLVNMEKTNHLIKLWITCVIQELHKSPAILELTRSIINSRQILKWLPKKECNQVEHVKSIVFQFVSHLGKTYASMQTLNEMSEFRKTINFYFSDFAKIAGSIVLNATCEKSLSFVFKVGGQLAQHCAKPIYSKTSPSCLLPQLLDLFVLPLTSSKKPLSSLVTKMLKEHVHLFLCGLASLDCKKDDFVARKVKEVLKKYFIEFSSRSTDDTMKNPFLISLHASCMENPAKTASDYRHLVLEYIREHCLYLPQPPEQLVSVLNFILELLQSTLSVEESMHTMKLMAMKMVSCILVCDAVRGKGEPRGVRKLAMNILRKMISQTSSSDSSRETFRALLHKFISDNLSYYQGTLLKTLHCMCLVSSSVMTSLLPDIEALIIEQEKKRGVGVDRALRESLHDLKSFVNNALDT